MGESPQPYQHVEVELLKYYSLMATFLLPPSDIPNTVSFVNMIFSCTIPYNSLIVPDIYNVNTFSVCMLLNPIELEYEAIYSTYWIKYDFNSSINSVDHSRYFVSSYNPFTDTLSIDESMMGIMMLDDTPWDDNHHNFSLSATLENNLGDIYSPNIDETFKKNFSIYDKNFDKKFTNIEEAITIDISIKPRVIKIVHISEPCSPNELKIHKAFFQ